MHGVFLIGSMTLDHFRVQRNPLALLPYTDLLFSLAVSHIIRVVGHLELPEAVPDNPCPRDILRATHTKMAGFSHLENQDGYSPAYTAPHSEVTLTAGMAECLCNS